jgi:hypothetical protein
MKSKLQLHLLDTLNYQPFPGFAKQRSLKCHIVTVYHEYRLHISQQLAVFKHDCLVYVRNLGHRLKALSGLRLLSTLYFLAAKGVVPMPTKGLSNQNMYADLNSQRYQR